MLDQLDFGGRRKVPMIRQAEGSECGLACLAMVAGFHGYEIDLLALRRRYQTSLKGATLRDLLRVAEDMNFSTRPVRGEVEDLRHLTLPAILHWDLNHFVVLTQISRRGSGLRYHINDPASGPAILSEAEMARRFTGVVLELTKSERFRPYVERTKLRLNQLWSRMEGFWPALRQVLLLSAILQLFALVAPFFLQIGIDSVLPGADGDLLLVLALGFGGLAVVAMITSWVRALVMVRLSSSLSYQVTVNLFHHLLRLPLPWFERRHVGDIVSRFGSTKPVSDILSQGLITSCIDGAMAFITLALMFVYSPALATLALAAVGLTSGLRFGFFEVLKQTNINAITANAREASAFIESIRGAATIKAFGEEGNRQRLWQQKKADAANAEIKAGRLNSGFTAGQEFILAIERVVFVYFAISFAMSGDLSLGMVFALQSYRQQFLGATTNLVQQAINYRLLDMHMSRIGDIALSEPEAPAQSNSLDAPLETRTPVKIELRNVRFRYAPNEAEIITGVNVAIEPGEMIALVGPSGGGKTTLLKIMMGLLEPTYGEVLIDGQPIGSYGLARWRKEIGSVAQDDALFAGSLADNICMFDAEPDNDRIKEAAESASIHHDIERMPMRYHTSVGDMGSVLSGGQKQRVVLARALYRQPVALFLDEATAHLDPGTEYRVGEAVRLLECTRVVIAHRPQTVQRAHRLFHVGDGQLRAIPIEVGRDEARLAAI